MSTKGHQLYLVLASLVLLALISIFSFGRNVGYLFPGGDGTAVLLRIADLHSEFSTLFGVSADMLEGFGDMAPVNYRLEPSYNLGLLALGAGSAYSGELHAFVNTVLSLELFLATFVAAQCFGFRFVASLMAAWLTPLLLLPFFGYPFLYPLLLFTPHAATMMSENLLALAAFTRLGRPLRSGTSPLWKDGLLYVAIVLLLTHMAINSPLASFLWLPVLVMLGFGLLFAAGSRAEARARFMWGAAAFVAWLAMFGVYTYGQYVYTATRFWATELDSNNIEWQFVSSWFRPLEPTGPIVISVALFGLLLALFDRPLRPLAIATLALMTALFGGGALMVNTDAWRGPAPVYIEVFLAPAYLMFAAYAVVRCGCLLRDAVLRYRSNAAPTLKRLQVVGSAIVVGIIPASAIAVATIPAFAINGPYHALAKQRIFGPTPPTRPPLVSTLVDSIAISPGSAFRGRVATLLLQNHGGPVTWKDLIKLHVVLVDSTGNDYYWSGLWPFRIPTLFEYSQVMSPAYFRTAVDLWARSGDKQIRNVVVLRQANPKTLALFGVKFVISDAPLPAPFRLEATERTSDSETLYLYKVPDVNLGGYSPTEIMKVATFNEALDAVSAPAFNAQQTAVVFDVEGDLKRRLVPAEDVQIRFVAGALMISASSVGTSLLILPFEFSRCLEVSSNKLDAPAPAILRVDGPLTGMLFSNRLSARIRYFTGPFNRPGCRIEDASDFSRLVRR
jgi:hypothetical protein